MLEKFDLVPYETPVCRPGDRFGRLTVLEVGRKKPYRYMAVCQCDCGSEPIVVRIDALRSKDGGPRKRTESCGCLQRESATTHGLTNHPLSVVWRAMMDRCYKEKCDHYKYYGARGITVCDEWHDISAFVRDMSPTYQQGLQIDRKDTDKGYSPENCRWATRKEQARNKRNNVNLTMNGETHCLSEWSEITGICIGTLWDRIFVRKWDDPVKILTTPPIPHSVSLPLALAIRWGQNS